MSKILATKLSLLKTIDGRWYIIWGSIYVSFLSLDILFPSSSGSSIIKYTGIFLCLIYAYQRSRKDHLLILALLFTLLADTILVWTNQFVFGIFVFCFAHFFHMTRFAKTSPKFLLMFYLIVVSIFLFATLHDIPAVYAIAFVYAMSLLTNVFLSIRWYRHDRKNPHAFAAAIGFILFLLCDTSVAIQHFSDQGVFTPFLFPIATYLVWLFYYPSQVLISNSSTLKQ